MNPKLDDVMQTIAPLMRNDIAYEVKRQNFFCRNVTMDWWPESTGYKVTTDTDGKIVPPEKVPDLLRSDFGATLRTYSLKQSAVASNDIDIAPDRSLANIYQDIGFASKRLTETVGEVWERAFK